LAIRELTPQPQQGSVHSYSWGLALLEKDQRKDMKNKVLAVLTGLLSPAPAFALGETWTPLITAENFTGIRTDLLTGVNGVILLVLIIVGVGMLIKVFR
jgi:hypothetical protein